MSGSGDRCVLYMKILPNEDYVHSKNFLGAERTGEKTLHTSARAGREAGGGGQARARTEGARTEARARTEGARGRAQQREVSRTEK